MLNNEGKRCHHSLSGKSNTSAKRHTELSIDGYRRVSNAASVADASSRAVTLMEDGYLFKLIQAIAQRLAKYSQAGKRRWIPRTEAADFGLKVDGLVLKDLAAWKPRCGFTWTAREHWQFPYPAWDACSLPRPKLGKHESKRQKILEPTRNLSRSCVSSLITASDTHFRTV